VNISSRNIATPILYIASALVVLALAALVKPGAAFFSLYWPVAFWLLVGVDFYKSQVVENGESELTPNRFSFADRFIGYIFVAPFILPVRLYQLVPVRARG
jgi:hypothetical protein